MKKKIYKIVFEAETRPGKIFDVLLLISIFISVLCLILETVPSFASLYGNEGSVYKDLFLKIELFFTILFTIEYFVRVYIVKHPLKYIFSFMGLIDLLAIIPTYLMIIVDWHSFSIIRSIRLIRIFRIFHLSPYVIGGKKMMLALRNSFPKIIVFLLSVVLLVTVLGTFMYLLEGPDGAGTEGFEDIPHSIYWSIVTLTTVGYGGVVPLTAFGKFFASIIMILGYGIIAVPTGIVSVAMVKNQSLSMTRTCSECMEEGHERRAKFCKSCGAELL